MLLHPEGHVSSPVRAMKRNFPAVNDDLVPFGMARIEQQDKAFVRTKYQQPTWLGEDLRQSQHPAVKLFGFRQIIDVKGRLEHTAKRRSSIGCRIQVHTMAPFCLSPCQLRTFASQVNDVQGMVGEETGVASAP